jgi:hypothetical protein
VVSVDVDVGDPADSVTVAQGFDYNTDIVEHAKTRPVLRNLPRISRKPSWTPSRRAGTSGRPV